MIDKDITIKRLEELCREVARIEFSHDFSKESIEGAICSRIQIERLIESLKGEKGE